MDKPVGTALLEKGVVRYLAVQFWAIGLGAFWFRARINSTGSPIVADPTTSRTVGLNNHGDWIFVEPWQSNLFHGSLQVGVIGFILMVALAQRRYGTAALTPLQPIASACGLAGGILFWIVAVNVGEG